ncbi:MAG: TRAP transporter substrate-binding protein DctP [Desulfatibacillaceae bacterium]
MKPGIRRGVLVAVAAAILAVAAPAHAGKVEWKLGTLAPKGVGWAKHIETMLHPALHEATDGNLRLKWYWGGIMGDDEDCIKKMRVGQLQGMGCSAQGITIGCREMSVLELPFMFKNLEEVWHIKREMRDTFEEIAEKNGFALLYWIDQDFDQIYSIRFRMDEPSDFEKAKVLTWYGPVEEHLLATMGARPVPVNVPEISPSIRQGVADTLIAPALWMVGSQMYSAVKFVNPVKIRYSPAGLLVSREAWYDLPDEWRANIMNGRHELEEAFSRKCAEDNEKSVRAMIRYGVRKVDMSDAQLTEMRERTTAIWDDLAGTEYPEQLLDELVAKLQNFRNGEKN